MRYAKYEDVVLVYPKAVIFCTLQRLMTDDLGTYICYGEPVVPVDLYSVSGRVLDRQRETSDNLGSRETETKRLILMKVVDPGKLE